MIVQRGPMGERRIVEHPSELPVIAANHTVFADAETCVTTGERRPSFRPYQGDRVCGWAVTWDNEPGAWYVPTRHTHGRNLDPALVTRWLQGGLKRAKRWVNHNVKYDAHFFLQDDGDLEGVELVDTVTLASTVDSDRMSHKLKTLARDWLNLEMGEEKEIKTYLREVKSVNYGDVPIDMLGGYACADVLSNRLLLKELHRRAYEDCFDQPDAPPRLWSREIALTKVLLNIERTGMRVDLRATKVEKAKCLRRMIDAQQQIHDDFGMELVDSTDVIYDILINQLGLPILEWTKARKTKGGGKAGGGNPSFDGDTLELYLAHPMVFTNDLASRTVRAIHSYRTESHFLSTFVESFLDKCDSSSVIHPQYRQTVRTGGRMACHDPNSMQQSPRSKQLFVPREGCLFLSTDASQLEYRFIGHVTQDPHVIRAYATDPKADYHQIMADRCGTSRSAGKTLNFAVAYGAGKKRVRAQLRANPDIIEEVTEAVEEEIRAEETDADLRAERMDALLDERASAIYADYHKANPLIKSTAQKASEIAGVRGYIKNAYKRRRHLPLEFSWLAFNTYVQGSAGDYVKDCMLMLGGAFGQEHGTEWMHRHDARMLCQVHDELLIEMPIGAVTKDTIPQLQALLVDAGTVPLRVPMRWDANTSTKNWKEAKP